MRRFGLAVLALLLLAGPAFAFQKEQSSTGEEQLKAAYEIKKQSFKKKGEEKREILLRAVEAYHGVKAAHPDDRKSCALALFRIGEIHRTLGQSDLALESFREALTYSEQKSTVARSLLEIGHLHRRAKQIDLAIDLYAQVPRQCPGQRSHAARALVWVAKCHRMKKELPEARSVLRGVVTEYEDENSTMLAAFDLLATLYLEEMDPVRARAVLEECREHFRALAESGDGSDAGYLAKVDKMKAWKLLAKAEAGAD
jgi:tetratricopeptide (TPR) repeat protein